MGKSRRRALRVLGGGTVVGLSGCTGIIGGQQEYAAVVMESRHSDPHMISAAVTTLPDEGGYTEYFSDVRLVRPGDSYEFDEGLAHSDYEPELMALVSLENETVERTDFTFDFDTEELRVTVSESGEMEIQPQA